MVPRRQPDPDVRAHPNSMRPPGEVTTLVIDTDPGIDDVVTLALAARSPNLEIVAVTTTYGNAPLDQTTRNAREVLRLCGRSDVQVLPGSDRPLTRALVTAPETHGESGVGYAPVAPATRVEPDNPHVLLDLLQGLKEPITLVTLGPLTNLARAIKEDVELVRDKVSHHIGMFGSIHERGNTNRWADFNAWCDPEAVDMVLQAGLDTLMVGLDVTRRMVLSADEVRVLLKSRDPLVKWLALALEFYVEYHVRQERLQGCVVNDVLTIGELLVPGLLQTHTLDITVDLDAGLERGHTREQPGGATTKVALDLDLPRMKQLLDRILGHSLGGEHVG
ncbi:MAG: nucleoside hydrolase [Gemmatimonadales bacterium]